MEPRNPDKLGCTLKPGGRHSHCAVLSRQSSFDDSGDTKLSSLQVKQRLKTHLLNRRRRCGAVDSYLHSDTDWRNTVDGAPLRDSPRGPGTYRAVPRWHSADSTSESRWPLSPGFDVIEPPLATSTAEHTNLGWRDTPSHESVSPHRPTIQLPENMTLLEMIEQLNNNNNNPAAPKDIGGAGTPFNLGGGVGTSGVNLSGDIRKTISAPNLFEHPWPLRIVSQLLLNHPSLIAASSSQHESTTVSPHLASLLSHRLTPAVTPAPSTAQSIDSVPLVDVLKQLHPSTADRPDALKDRSELASIADPLQQRACVLQHPAPWLSSRPPLETSASEDSAVERTALEWKMRAYLTELMRTEGHQISCELSDRQLSSRTTPPPSVPPAPDAITPAASSSGLPPCESAMDWEMDGTGEDCSQHRATPPPVAPSTELSESSLSNSSPDLFAAWTDLPVEDWLSSPFISNPSACCPTTGLAFDPNMLHHSCVCPTALEITIHPECSTRVCGVLESLSRAPFRTPPSLTMDLSGLLRSLETTVAKENKVIQQALCNLVGLGPDAVRVFLAQLPLVGFCRLYRARMATEEELCLFHTREYVHAFGTVRQPLLSPAQTTPSSTTPLLSTELTAGCPRLCKLSCGGLGVDSDTVWNPTATAQAARLAVGQVLCLAHKVATRQLRNGFALIRPPGHHAEPSLAMGFCYFNSVAVAALHLIRDCAVSRVLILDWDIHHGNGTKYVTAHHPGLVYVSVHRFDRGTFFPGTGPIVDLPPKSRRTSSEFGSGCDSDRKPFQSSQRSQLINIAWETPQIPGADDDRSLTVDAGARRELWRQYCSRQKTPRFVPKGSSSTNLRQSADTSCSSITNSTRDTPGCSLCCRQPGTSIMGSTGSSGVFCSTCLSQSRLSSLASSASLFTDSAVGSAPRHVTSVDSSSPSILGFGDAEYLAAFRCVVLPIAYEFQPEVILISAGFDAASGHGEALGGYSVSPGTFAWITRQCLSVADGRVVMALEGGYNPSVVGDCVTACLNSLLLPTPQKQWVPCPPKHQQSDADSCLDAYQSACDWIASDELHRPPYPEAVATLTKAVQYQAQHGWRCMQYVQKENIAMSFSEAVEFERRMSLQPAGRSTVEPYVAECNSPLTAGFAQLRMDQS